LFPLYPSAQNFLYCILFYFYFLYIFFHYSYKRKDYKGSISPFIFILNHCRLLFCKIWILKV
jgi:hypothetical protein